MNQVILAINILSQTVDNAMVSEDQIMYNKIKVGISDGAHEENCDSKATEFRTWERAFSMYAKCNFPQPTVLWFTRISPALPARRGMINCNPGIREKMRLIVFH